MGNRGPQPGGVSFEQLVALGLDEPIREAVKALNPLMQRLAQELEPATYICEGCGRHLPCRHCEEAA